MPKPSKTADWWYHLESNQGHTDFQSVALPTELWYRFFNAVQIYGKISFFKIQAKNLLSSISTFPFHPSPTPHTIKILISLKFAAILPLKNPASETKPVMFLYFCATLYKIEWNYLHIRYPTAYALFTTP